MKDQLQTPVSFTGKHTFTQSEKDQKLAQMLTAMRVKQEIEDELKTTKSTYKAKIDARDAEIKLISNLLNAGFEDRVFQCILTKNFDSLQREYHEIGTNLLIGTEPLTTADHQMQLKLTEEAIKEQNKETDPIQDIIFEKASALAMVPDGEPEYTVEPNANPLEFVSEEPQPQEGGIETAPDDFSFDDPDESNTDDDDPFSF